MFGFGDVAGYCQDLTFVFYAVHTPHCMYAHTYICSRRERIKPIRLVSIFSRLSFLLQDEGNSKKREQ